MKYTIPALTIVLLLLSCQKEVSNNLQSSPPADSSSKKTTLLTWVKYNSDGDTGSAHFTYDASNRLVLLEQFKKVKDYMGNITRIIRDNSGTLIGFIQDVGTIDSLFSIVYHDTLNKHFTYMVQYNTASIATIDSTVFTYNGSHIGSSILYETDSMTGKYRTIVKRIFTYDINNNMLTDQWYSYDAYTNSFSPNAYTYSFSYDQKTSPLILGDESTLLEIGSNGPNNVIKEQMTGGNPGDTNLLTYQYSYNSDNRPKSDSSVASPQGFTTIMNFIYQ
jgi:hypothetical protein